MGRSRLLKEFAALAGADHGAWLLTPTGSPAGLPLGPLRRAEASGPLPMLQQALTDPADLPDYFGRLVSAVGREARRAPLWLLIDDLHAADEATRTFAERLVAAVHYGSLRDCRIGVVLSLLSDHAGKDLRERLDAQDRRGAAIRIPLEPLGADGIRRWLKMRFTAEPDDELVRLLTESSGGNPLLLNELTVYLQRSGILREVDNRLTASRRQGAGLSLPRDLPSLLHDKLGAVSGECRRAMTVAAFLGNEFDSPTLADLLDTDNGALEQLIDEAAGASLVERRDGCRVSFKHTSSRELLYAQPDRVSREQTHLHVCEGLIGELGAEANDHCLTIAHHLIGAGTRADPTLVLHYASRAADLAFRHHSYYLAGRYYEAAARAGRDALADDELAALHCRAGESFQRWSDGERSTACFLEAVRLYERCDHLEGYASALQGLLRNRVAFGDHHTAGGDSGGEASAAAARLQGLLGSLPEENVELRVRVHDALAGYHHSAARYDRAEACAQTAMNIARNSGNPALRCIPVTSLALAQMEQLRLTDATTTWLEGLSYDRAAGARHYEGLHLQRLPVPLYCLGETQEAHRFNQDSYKHNEAIGNTGELCLNLTVDVMLANLSGRFEEAIATGREALGLMTTTRYLWSAPSLISALAYALAMLQRVEESRSVIDHLSTDGLIFENTGPYRSAAARLTHLVDAHCGQASAEAHAPGHGSLHHSVRGVRVGSLGRLCSEAELALFQRRPERLSGVHDALEYVHRRGLALALGWCCSIPRSLAISTALRSGFSRAAGYFDEATKLAQRANAPLEEGRVDLYRGLAALVCEDTDPGQAQSHLTRALTRFEQLHAPALAQLASDALSRDPDLFDSEPPPRSESRSQSE